MERGTALADLGLAEARRGRLDRAEHLLRQALAEGAGAEGQNNLGMVLLARGRPEEAAARYRAAIVQRPGYAVALNNLGIALGELGRSGEVLRCYSRALAVFPRYVEALNNLGGALHAAGDYRDAAGRFEAALEMRADFSEARINLGHSLAELGRREEAMAHYRTALRANPGNAELHLDLADLLKEAESGEAALRHYRCTIALSPESAMAYSGLGGAVQEQGEIEAGRRGLQRAFVLEPRRPLHALQFVRAATLSPENPHLGTVLALEDDIGALGEGDRIDAHFALGKALADIGRDSRSFEHILAGNKLKRKAVVYDEAKTLGRMEKTIRIFTADRVRSASGGFSSSDLPIFIVGMPRSGSTLVEQILASHPAVHGAGEVDLLRKALDEAGLDRGIPHFSDWRTDRLAVAAELYLDRLRRLAGGRPVSRVTDKLLGNFRYAGLIRLMFPNARILHTVRDPVDTCLSCFSIQFAKQPFTYDLGELGRYYRAYERLMRHWRQVLPEKAMLEVRYEKVVGDLEAEARRILDYCGLGWDAACLRFHETRRPVRTASITQVRRPLYRESIRRWRPDEAVLRPLIEALADPKSPARGADEPPL